VEKCLRVNRSNCGESEQKSCVEKSHPTPEHRSILEGLKEISESKKMESSHTKRVEGERCEIREDGTESKGRKNTKT